MEESHELGFDIKEALFSTQISMKDVDKLRQQLPKIAPNNITNKQSTASSIAVVPPNHYQKNVSFQQQLINNMSECSLPLETCHRKIKVKCLRIPRLKLNQTSNKEKEFWKETIRQIEKVAREKAKDDKLKIYDYSTSLPPELYKRVAKIIPLVPIEEDVFEDEVKDYDLESEPNEDGDITETHKQIQSLACVENTARRALKKQKDKKSWYSDYICSRRKDRIKWSSKIYNLERKIWEKSLTEQAEHLMDTAAERFSEWVNKLSDNEQTNISKELIKEYFSVDLQIEPLAAIKINPTELKTIPQSVSTKWNLPKKSMETKYEDYLKDKEKMQKKNLPNVAFGRTIPPEMKSWVPLDAPSSLQPVFPEELITQEKIFQGIGHLTATKKLIQFYKEHPDLPRPKYLIAKGYFRNTEQKVKKTEIPFYELL